MLRAQTKTTTSSIARNNVDSSNYKIVRNRLFQRNPIAAMDAISLEEFKQIHKLNDRDNFFVVLNLFELFSFSG